MDIALIRTFLEVAATGSFVNAADRLFVTQSAVSLRVQRLEDSIGRTLFTRSKAGAELTPAGVAFERYAISLVKLWEEARQQVAIPEGFTASLTIGAQYSLWPRLGFRWIESLRKQRSDLNIRAEVGMPDRLTRFLLEGVVQAALTYGPQLRPGIRVEKVLDEDLVLVAGWPNPTLDMGDRYVFIDWGPEFVQAHALHLPGTTNPGMTMALGTLGGDYIRRRGLAAYLPDRYAERFIANGTLHLVPDAPRFPYPAWIAWREDLDPKVQAFAAATLADVARDIDAEATRVGDALDGISAQGMAEVLGTPRPFYK